MQQETTPPSITQPTVLSLVARQPIAANIWRFTFRPSQPITWTAGQFIKIELPHPHPDPKGTVRRFTIASPPHAQTIDIATRITTSSFKQALSTLPPSGLLKLIDPPAGDFVWRTSPHPLVFVAQGIGITPFLSMLRDRVYHSQPLPAILIYTNFQSDIPFRNELQALAESHPEFHLHLNASPITPPKLAELIPNLSSSLVYVSGPKPLTALLAPPYNLPPGQLKSDLFPNYSSADY